MDCGWIKVHRSIADHWVFNDQFSTFGAWVDLLLMANYKDAKIYTSGELINVEKGSFITSIVKLGNRWNRDRKWVSKFLDNLEKDKMITQKRDNRFTVISICNYSRFQGYEEIEGQPWDNLGTTSGQPWDTNKERKERKEYKKDLKNTCRAKSSTEQIFEQKNQELVQAKKNKWADSVREIFEHWVEVMGKDPKRAKLNPTRRRMVEARLKEGYDIKTLMIAIDGLAKTPWNMGKNPRQKRYDDFKYFCGDGTRVEDMGENALNPPRASDSKSQSQVEAELKETTKHIMKCLNVKEENKNEEKRGIDSRVFDALEDNSRCDGKKSNE